MGERLGFIGLGIMGSGMVGNLIKAGHSPTVWNRTPGKSPDGVNEVPDLETLAGKADLIFICVSDTPDVVEVTEGLRPHLQPGQLIVDHSTISPFETRDLAASLSDQSWLDAPVSGSSEGAARGTLSTMVGGNEADLERARPYLSAYSTNITHLGPVGNGQLAKLVNQILVVGNQLAASEALLFAEAAGLDLPTTLDAIKDGAAGSWMLANRGPQMIANDWRPGFTINLQQKDLRLVLDTADELGTPLPATSLIFQLYRGLQAAGHGHEGNHALIKALKQLAGSG
ncbi:MAG: NAD(P)-dependent oxidoreductase [Actinobacteria bacterium]|nr:NAD(P)-dependent oxidoreductase [Actinomycetota bacterium]